MKLIYFLVVILLQLQSFASEISDHTNQTNNGQKLLQIIKINDYETNQLDRLQDNTNEQLNRDFQFNPQRLERGPSAGGGGRRSLNSQNLSRRFGKKQAKESNLSENMFMCDFSILAKLISENQTMNKKPKLQNILLLELEQLSSKLMSIEQEESMNIYEYECEIEDFRSIQTQVRGFLLYVIKKYNFGKEDIDAIFQLEFNLGLHAL